MIIKNGDKVEPPRGVAGVIPWDLLFGSRHNQMEKQAEKWYIELRESRYKYIASYKERIDSLFSYQKKLHEIIDATKKPEVQIRAISELHSIETSIFNLWKQLPDLRERATPGWPKTVRSKVHKSSMRATLEQFDKSVDAVIDPETKLLCVYSIKHNLRKYVKFDNDDDEQKWYSEKYPNDPSNDKNGDGAGVGSNAELALEAIKNYLHKLFVDEYQNPHIAISVSGI